MASITSDHAIYEGSINIGFKTNDAYTDANFSIVAPLWSTIGTNGTLGGGALFLEPYSSWGEKGEIATSLGLGFRYLFNNQPISALRNPKKGQASFFEEGVAIGGSFFVDSLHTESDNDFWQLGVGAEIATRYVEFRGNYYIPQTGRKLAERKTFNETITKSQTTDRSVTSAGSPYDDGNGYLVQDLTTSVLSTTQTTTTTLKHILSRYEEGMKGWDLEMALLVPYVDQWADVKLIGGYFHLENQPFGPQTGGTGPVKGWKAGVEVRPVPALVVTGMWYEDKRFLGADWIVGARMEIPFEFGDIGDGKNFWSRIGDAFRPRRRHLVERLAEPVRRQNAAIKTGTSETQSTQQTGSQTHTNVQVISQSSQHIILGPGPSGTDFQYSTSGSLSVAAPDGNGGTTTQTVSGSLYVNRIGNTLFVPTNGGSTLLFASAPPLSNVQTVTPPTEHLTVTDNLFIGGATTISSSVVTLSSQLTNPTLSSAVLNSGTLTISNTQTTGSSLTLSGGTVTIGNGGLGKTGSGTLNLSGGSLGVGNSGYTGSTAVNGGTITFNNAQTTGSVQIPSGGTVTGSGANTGSATLDLSGGSLVVSNAGNTGSTVNSGTLTISNAQTTGSGQVPSGGTVTGGGLTKITSGAFATTGIVATVTTGGGIPTGSGTLNLGGGSLVVSNAGTTGSTLSYNGQTSGVVLNTGILPTLQISSGGRFTFPTTSTASSITFGNNVQIGGVSVPSGTYPITGGVITVGGAPVTLFGSTITAAP